MANNDDAADVPEEEEAIPPGHVERPASPTPAIETKAEPVAGVGEVLVKSPADGEITAIPKSALPTAKAQGYTVA